MMLCGKMKGEQLRYLQKVMGLESDNLVLIFLSLPIRIFYTHFSHYTVSSISRIEHRFTKSEYLPSHTKLLIELNMNSKTRQHRNNDRGGRGRGRGKNPPPGKEANKATSTTTTSPTPIRNSDNKTLKRNGEKGAEVHTVSEETRIQFTKMMVDFREDHQMDALEMPKDLTNTERKFLHQLAGQLGLKSKSSGKGDDRRITITKAGDNERKRAPGLGTQIPLLHIGANGEAALDSYIRDFPPDEVEAAESTETGSSLRNGSPTKVLSTLEQLKIQSSSNVQSKKPKTKPVNLESRVAMHHKYQQEKLQNPTFKSVLAARKQLPALAYEKEICDIVRDNQVTLLSGDTGCGKSTQLPQFLLDDLDMGPTCKVCITQPRRISAMTIAERVASERCEEVGSVVGYNVRLESCSSPSTQLLFVTPGILLRKFQSSPDLEEFTHIVIDEIHERDRYTEFLMIALKELINRRSDLRIVLMSATIQTNELLQYWTGAGCLKENIDERIPADINIPGRMFPVQTFFLEDVLAMTGFVGDESALMTGDLTDLETDLSKLLGSLNDKPKSKSKKGQSKVLTTKDHSLVCVLCNQSGFKCPEELGSHIGLCMGSGNMTASDLETKVRKTHVVSKWEQQEGNGGSNVDDDVLVDAVEEDQEIILDDDDNDVLGLHEGHWDGSSPFGVADIITNTKNSFSEEDMLNRYHLMHDDEQVDNDLILNIIRYINKSSYGDGAILVFLPGWMEISELSMILESTTPFSDKSQFLILPMHSGIPSKDQRLVFQRPRRGVRKIVLSTNICEASVTIDDVAFVIDTGRAKEKSYDPHLNTSTLQPIWISQASAKQRRGRAGRTKAGVCFHLFSRRRHASFREFLESEMIRTSLEEICLQCKKLNLCPGGIDDVDGIPSFLSRALTPPHPKAVLNAIADLVRLGAMEVDTNDLTKLGHCLACLSVEPKVGKMVIWSYILGCSKDTASIAVAMSYKVRYQSIHIIAVTEFICGANRIFL